MAIPLPKRALSIDEICELALPGLVVCTLKEPLPIVGTPHSGLVETIKYSRDISAPSRDQVIQSLLRYRVMEGQRSPTSPFTIELNPDLALRNIGEYEAGQRKLAECVRKGMEPGGRYDFLKSGQRLHFFDDEFPLLETQGNQKLSRPLASITMLEAMQFMQMGKPCTKGTYLVKDKFDPSDPRVHFESYKRLLMG
jgi:hypothetical protein